MTFLQDLHIVWYMVRPYTIVCPEIKCPKIEQDKIYIDLEDFRCQNNGNLNMDDFLQK